MKTVAIGQPWWAERSRAFHRLIAYLSDDFLLICVAKQGQIAVPDNEGDQAMPVRPSPNRQTSG